MNAATPWLLAAIAILAGSSYFMYVQWDKADARADAAEHALEVEKANAKVVERVVTVEKEVIRRVPVIQRELVRLCDGASEGAGVPDEAAGSETGDVRARRLQALGSEVADSLSESEQLIGLQAAVKNAGCANE